MRLEGWEARLAAVVEGARFRRFAWGEHDCYRFACRAVEALTGEDRWTPFARGGYTTKVGALRRMLAYAPSFEGFVSLAFEVEPGDVRLARVGDVVLIPIKRLDALGVCVGREVAVLLEDRLGFVPRRAGCLAWRIG